MLMICICARSFSPFQSVLPQVGAELLEHDLDRKLDHTVRHIVGALHSQQISTSESQQPETLCTTRCMTSRGVV